MKEAHGSRGMSELSLVGSANPARQTFLRKSFLTGSARELSARVEEVRRETTPGMGSRAECAVLRHRKFPKHGRGRLHLDVRKRVEGIGCERPRSPLENFRALGPKLRRTGFINQGQTVPW
jgi:hypothetical protein